MNAVYNQQDVRHFKPICGSKCNLLAVVCCRSSISARDEKLTNKLIKKAGDTVGLKRDTFESVRDQRSLSKLLFLNNH